MKKLFLLFAIGMFATTISFGQIQDDCGPNSIFSQSLLDPPHAYTSDEAGNIQMEDFEGLTTDISGMTFWGFMWDGSGDCYTSGSQDFEIKFFQDDAGSTVGALVATFNVTLTPIVTGLFYTNGASILRYEVVFPSTVALTDGWFSVVKQNPTSDICKFYYLDTSGGDNHSAYILSGTPNDVHYSPNNRAFCLSGTSSVPVSNWALVIGLLLMIGFIVFRFRKRLV